METQVLPVYEGSPIGEDEEMSQTDLHNTLLFYMAEVIKRIFADQQQQVGVYISAQLYGDPLQMNKAKSPDLMVIDGLEQGPNHDLVSYYIKPNQPPPRFILEAASDSTWENDVKDKLDDKPAVYARMGVPEYFAADPHIEPIWTGQWRKQGRLLGWQLDPHSFQPQYRRIPLDAQGRLWSEQLQSYLVMEGVGQRELHLYDRAGQLRLTEKEYYQAQAEAERQQRLAERREKLAERQQRLVERQQRLAAEAAAEVERQERQLAEATAEVERQRAERLREILRRLQPDFNEDEL